MPFDNPCSPERPDDPKALVRLALVRKMAGMLGRDPTEEELAKLDAALRDWEP